MGLPEAELIRNKLRPALHAKLLRYVSQGSPDSKLFEA